MTIEEWVRELVADAENFRNYWIEKNAEDPIMFPMEYIFIGDIDEQFEEWR